MRCFATLGKAGGFEIKKSGPEREFNLDPAPMMFVTALKPKDVYSVRPVGRGAENCWAEPARRRISPDDSCIQCHMPPYAASDVIHTASTDHRIPRKPAPRS